MSQHIYDIAIIGAGVTGCEAALGCAQNGLDTLLVTTSLDTVYNLVGDTARLEPPPNTLLADVFAEHAQGGFLKSWDLHSAAKQHIETIPEIHFLQSSVSALRLEHGAVTGIDTWEGVSRFAKRTALCVGSFLQARLTVGSLTENAGRLSEMAYDDLYDNLLDLGFAFESLELSAEAQGGSLPYKVNCQVFAENERDGFKLKRFENLYAAGVCAAGYLSYEEAAARGLELAASLKS